MSVTNLGKQKVNRRVLSLENLQRRELMAADIASPAGMQPVVAGLESTAAAQKIFDTQVVAFDVTTAGKLTFNLGTGAYSANVNLPGGAKLDSSALKTLLAGQLAIPKVDPIQAAVAFAGLKTNITSNYDSVQRTLNQQHGGGNVYLSSQRFTDWASPENAAATIGSAVVTGGSTSGQLIQEAKDVILGELGNIYVWLKNKAVANLDATMAAVLKSVVSGTEVSTPQFSIKNIKVEQTYHVGLGGAAAKIADGLGSNATSKSVTANHLGFALIWKGGVDNNAAMEKSLKNFNGAAMSQRAAFTEMIAQIAKRSELKNLGKVASAILTTNPSAAIDASVTAKLASSLGLTQAQLRQLYQKGNPIIDLRSTPLDEQLGRLLGNLAAGNKGSSVVTQLQFNLNTYEITAVVSIRHVHTWGSVSDILKAVGKQAGQWVDEAGNTVKQTIEKSGTVVLTTSYKAGNRVRETWTKAGDRTKQTWEKSGTSIRTTWFKAGDVVEETWNKAGDHTTTTVKKAGEKTRVTLYKAGNKLSENWNKAGDYTKQVWDKAGNTVRTTLYKSGKIVEETWKKQGDTIKQVWEKNGKTVRTTVYKAGNKLEETWNKAGDYTKQTWDKAGKSVRTTWYKAGDKVEESWNKAGDYTKKTWDAKGKYAENTWNKSGKLISGGAKSVTNVIKKLF